ncbi:K02A2.6-like [Cordylochernes scorpioides]|uniref:K02A2.6-like n=1 Tax=Cordylochernes scorpioides TaxID=51811 RepID=A0ABY6LRZ9_9ARAC|nr:K02A2.6-like [Cordylochernes scorpioides]
MEQKLKQRICIEFYLKLAEFPLKMIFVKDAQKFQRTDENDRNQIKNTPAKFIPRFLTNEQKLCRLATCEDMLEMTRTDPEWKDKIITGYETWGELSPKKSRLLKSRNKVLLVAFLDKKGIFHHEYLHAGQTVIKDMYLGILRRLKEAIRKKRPEKWTNGGWILHHDNARPHTAHLMTSFLAKNGTQILLQPPFFPDIAPNDLFLFPKLEAVLKGRHFDTRDDIIEKSPLALKSIPKEAYKNCFDNWEKRWCCVIVQRFHFNKHNQGNESIASYIAELRILSENCEFVDLDDRLRDRLVCGLIKESLVKRLLSEAALTFEKAINIALCDESASANASVLMETTPDVNILKKANKGEPFNFNSKKQAEFNRIAKGLNKKIICIRCKGNHSPHICKFRNSKCFKCGKIGHLQKACLTRVKKFEYLHRSNSDTYLHCLGTESLSNPFYIMVKLDNHDVSMLIDSGSAYSLLNKETFLKYWKVTQLEKSEVLLKTWSPSHVKILGKPFVKAKVTNGFEKLSILVADEPKFVKARTVPFALRELVDEKLKSLEDQGVIEPVKLTKWASPIVTVLKNDGTVRICHDYKITVNLYSNPDKYPLPTIPQFLDRLRGGRVFTKLDMAQAYQQLKVDETSAEILAINTPIGLYKVKRLPFGLNSAVGTFQRFMDTLLSGIDGVAVYLDDVLISGRDCDDLKRKTEKVLLRFMESGLRLKREKCK